MQLLEKRGVGCNQLETTKFLVFKFTRGTKKIHCYSQCYPTKTSINFTIPSKPWEILKALFSSLDSTLCNSDDGVTFNLNYY